MIVKTKYAGYRNIAELTINFKRYGIGVIVHEWGIRLLLIYWQACIFWPAPNTPLHIERKSAAFFGKLKNRIRFFVK